MDPSSADRPFTAEPNASSSNPIPFSPLPPLDPSKVSPTASPTNRSVMPVISVACAKILSAINMSKMLPLTLPGQKDAEASIATTGLLSKLFVESNAPLLQTPAGSGPPLHSPQSPAPPQCTTPAPDGDYPDAASDDASPSDNDDSSPSPDSLSPVEGLQQRAYVSIEDLKASLVKPTSRLSKRVLRHVASTVCSILAHQIQLRDISEQLRTAAEEGFQQTAHKLLVGDNDIMNNNISNSINNGSGMLFSENNPLDRALFSGIRTCATGTPTSAVGMGSQGVVAATRNGVTKAALKEAVGVLTKEAMAVAMEKSKAVLSDHLNDWRADVQVIENTVRSLLRGCRFPKSSYDKYIKEGISVGLRDHFQKMLKQAVAEATKAKMAEPRLKQMLLLKVKSLIPEVTATARSFPLG